MCMNPVVETSDAVTKAISNLLKLWEFGFFNL